VDELTRYLQHFRPHWRGVVAAVVLLSIAAVIPGGAVLLLQQTLDDVLVAGDTGRLGLLCLSLVGLYLLRGGVAVVRTHITKRIAWAVTSEMRCALHRHYLQLSPRQQGSTGERVAALTSEVDALQYGVSAVVTAIRNPLTLAVLAATAAWLAPSLAPIALVLLPAAWLCARWGGRLLRRRARSLREARSALIHRAAEQLEGLALLQAYGAVDRAGKAFAEAADVDQRARLRLEVERILPAAVTQTAAAAVLGGLLWVGGAQVGAGTLAPGELVGFAVALALMNRPLGGLAEVWSLMQRSLGALEKVYDVMEVRPLVQEPTHPRDLPAGPLSVSWEGVAVDFGQGPVLSGLELVARPSEILGLVGPTGAGKSTLLRMVTRQVRGNAGCVRIGGVPVDALRRRDLVSAVAIVQQEGFLFTATVAQNLRLGAPLATDRDLEAALRAAGAEFVFGLPQGLETHLEDRGDQLSGGERQRLCLARALVTGARVLLLDEATNQVDAETSAEILERLRDLAPGRTVVFVAHDLATVRHAHRVALLDGGRLMEIGTHNTLVASGGRYASLWQAVGILH
jgi:ATP-binding cassette, subfamily B, bacterial